MIWGDERGQVRALIYALVVIGAVVASVAIARADTVIDEAEGEEWPRALPTLLTEGRVGSGD